MCRKARAKKEKNIGWSVQNVISQVGKGLSKRVSFLFPEQSHKRLYVFLIYVILALATFIAFEQVRHSEFVSYDDGTYVTENPYVKDGITPRSFIWAFTTSHSYNWHPLTWLSHMLDCTLFGLNPLWHHLTNLFFHIANTLLLFWVLKRMTGAIWCSGFVAAAFALHPLHVESVAWVAQRKDVLSAFFWMLTMAAYVRYAEKPDIRRYMVIFLFLLLGLMAKPMLVTLPAALLLLDYWPLERFQLRPQSGGQALPTGEPLRAGYQKSSVRHLILEKIPLFVLVAVFCVITINAQQGGGAIVPLKVLPLSLRIENAAVSYVSYINKMIYPRGLVVLYPYPTDGALLWRQSVVCFMKLAVVSAFVIYVSRRRRYLVMGWLWYLGTLVPVIGLVQVGPQAMADRYSYLPSVGFFIMVAWGVGGLVGQSRYRKIGMGVLMGLTLTVLLLCTRMQVRHWQNDFTLFGHAIEVTKRNPLMYNYYGDALLEEGRIEEASQKFHEALRISPNHPLTHYNLGRVMAQKGNYDEAIEHLKKALQAQPGWPQASNLLREIQEKTKQPE